MKAGCSRDIIALDNCVFRMYMCVDDLGELLLGECKLQTYLKENPIKQGASPRGPRPKLVEVRKHLTAALDRGNLKVIRESDGLMVADRGCV